MYLRRRVLPMLIIIVIWPHMQIETPFRLKNAFPDSVVWMQTNQFAYHYSTTKRWVRVVPPASVRSK